MSKVQTTKGLIEHTELTVKDIPGIDGESRVMATEWYLGNEMVRRDVWVNLLRSVELSSGE
jgi:hypothetical protein